MRLNVHRLWQIVFDAGLVALAWYLAFQLRFDNGLPPYYQTLFDDTIWIVVPISVAVFAGFGFYSRWWRYTSMRDLWMKVLGVTAACVVSDLVVYFANPVATLRLPRSIAFVNWLLLCALVLGSRLVARTLFERPSPRRFFARGREVVIVGAGDAGQLVVREMLRSAKVEATPIGYVDDDPRKRHARIHGVRVLGTIAELPHVLSDNRPDEVLIAIPSASGELRAHVVEIARKAGVPVKTLPGIHELIVGEANLAGRIRPVEVEDLLGREAVEVDLRTIGAYLEGRTVMVTGAGGSIGSELCRQIARVGAGRIVLVDHAETSLFEIERELVDERHYAACVPVVGDAGNRTKMRSVIERYRPSVVFHAAAYKHVPLMEANPLEAVRNNTLATRALAEVCVEFGVERFVLVSTDKAVAAKTVMGQSKALCEWIVEELGSRPGTRTEFVAVRFGNVLGSAGSVIPTFRRQIARGGPVTVTHPEMTRYFMTIPEAVSLIVQAGGIGETGHVFLLDMGEPVRIMDLAQNMIRLSGKEPGRDVAIEVTGVRPGEKLHEDLRGPGEEPEPTGHAKIVRLRRPAIDPVWLDRRLAELEHLVVDGATLDVVAKLNSMLAEPRWADARTVAASGSPAETAS